MIQIQVHGGSNSFNDNDQTVMIKDVRLTRETVFHL